MAWFDSEGRLKDLSHRVKNYFRTNITGGQESKDESPAEQSEREASAQPSAGSPAEHSEVELTMIDIFEDITTALEQDDPAVQAEESTAEQTVETPAAQTEETPAAQTEETPAAQTEEPPAAQAEDAPAAQTEETTAEQTKETPAAQAEDAPAAQTEETTAEQTKEIPAEQAGDAPAAQAEETAPSESKVRDSTVSLETSENDAGCEAGIGEMFRYFREICGIPHGSFHTEKMSDYLEQFAKEHALDYIRDEMGNLIIRRPGSAGFEHADPLALQGHIDMVCACDDTQDLDMTKDPITLLSDDEWLFADRTTLGGDDGIAVAVMLSLLSDPSVKCPPLECIFTVDEEVGLLGAAAIDLSSLKSRRLINIDSEEEGVITASCAGGIQMVCNLPGKRKIKQGTYASIEVTGLLGGHSGEKIKEGRANAVFLMARLLWNLQKQYSFSIVRLEGGIRDNVIPMQSKAEILFKQKGKKKADPEKIRETIEAFTTVLQNEYKFTDPDIRVNVYIAENDDRVRKEAFTRKDSLRIIRFLMAMPNGVIEYIPGNRELPQTSLNLGIARTLEDGLFTQSMIRSSVTSQKRMVADRIHCIALEFGASVESSGEYPAWEFIPDSQFRDLASKVYEDLTGKQPEISIIHAGLECGLLSAKVPGIDCISIGPDMEDIHTPKERLNIASARRTYTYIRSLLAACAES